EDGIRDRNVTGVQTCAIPISLGLIAVFLAVFEKQGLEFVKDQQVKTLTKETQRPEKPFQMIEKALGWLRFPIIVFPIIISVLLRSEERRVGKVCRSLCWTALW